MFGGRISLKKNIHISFDVEGTLVTKDFSNYVWLKLLPSLYMEKNGLSFEEAYKYVLNKYRMIGDRMIEWYMLNYWIERFKLEVNPEALLLNAAKAVGVKPYNDAMDAIKEASKLGRIILITNSTRAFLKFLLSPFDAETFYKVFSVVDDFKLTKYDSKAYRKVLESLRAEPSDIFHIGDDFIQDYIVPKSIGIRSFYLSRNSQYPGGYKSLNEIVNTIAVMVGG